jgi:hypothetical protein
MVQDAQAAPRRQRGRWRLRPLLRALHRDAGYFAVGLTFIYAVSGLAVNHIADWEPNFREIRREHRLPAPWPADDASLAEHVAQAVLGGASVREVYRLDEHRLEVSFDRTTLRVDTTTGHVVEEGREPRFFLRVANWLHLNRGKKAWTYIADAYAVLLLLLSTTRLWMYPGRKGIWGRAGLIAVLGALVPALYVVLSGGP